MTDRRISPVSSIKEIGRKCREAHRAELEGASWLKRISYCAAGVFQEIKAGFSAQADYPLGRISER